MTYTLADLAIYVDGRVVGDGSARVTGVTTLEKGGEGCVSFLANPKYRRQVDATTASAVVVSEAVASDPTINNQIDLIVVDNPHVAYAKLTHLFRSPLTIESGLAVSVHISTDVTIADDVSIGANVYIGAGTILESGVVVGPGCVLLGECRIGKNSALIANITVYPKSQIGEHVLIHAGVIIGADGFGFANENGKWIKVEQLGGVYIGDDVEIGANTTIDCGAIDDTVIESGVKLDNQIQIAHNVRIGRDSAIAACTGIAGSATIGQRCQIAGSVGILGHLSIADDVVIMAKTLVTKSIKSAGLYAGAAPFQPHAQWQKSYARTKQLDALAHRIRALEKRLAERDNED